MPILAIIFTRGGGTLQAHKAKDPNYGQQGEGSTTEQGGIMEVVVLAWV